MAKVVVAFGSSLDRKKHEVSEAQIFIETLCSGASIHSSLYESEPVGPSKNQFINAVSSFDSILEPHILLQKFKEYESRRGRDQDAPAWTDRIIDLDIITFNSLIIKSQRLTIPHPLYHSRKFVLIPLKEIYPNWIDPETGNHIDQLIENAEALKVTKVTK